MKALTLHRPWDRAIAELGKDVENRDWKLPEKLLGEQIAIHSGKVWDATANQWIQVNFGNHGLTGYFLQKECPPGMLVAVVRFTSCKQRIKSPWAQAGSDYQWLIGEMIPIKIPIGPIRGLPGLWDVPEWAEEKIEIFLGG